MKNFAEKNDVVEILFSWVKNKFDDVLEPINERKSVNAPYKIKYAPISEEDINEDDKILLDFFKKNLRTFYFTRLRDIREEFYQTSMERSREISFFADPGSFFSISSITVSTCCRFFRSKKSLKFW